MLNNLSKLFWVSRPISWPNTAYPFAAAFILTGGGLSPFFWIASLFFLIPYNLLMYGINDIFDYESDIRNPRKGGIEGLKEQSSFHPIIFWAAILTTAPFIVFLLISGSLAANVTLLAVIFFVVAYSLGGLRFKEKPILDSITSSIHFVGPMIYAMVLTGFQPDYLPYVIAFFFWGVASHAFGAVQDIVPDREGGLASVATVLGARKTMIMVVSLYLLASIIVFTQGWPALVVGLAGLAYVANALPHLKIDDESSGRSNEGWRRFIWLNLFTGFVVTMVLIAYGVYGVGR